MSLLLKHELNTPTAIISNIKEIAVVPAPRFLNFNKEISNVASSDSIHFFRSVKILGWYSFDNKDRACLQPSLLPILA